MKCFPIFKLAILSLVIIITDPAAGAARPAAGVPIVKDSIAPLQNPMSVEYLQKNLRRESPRLILTPALERNLKSKLTGDPVIKNVYRAMQLNAEEIQQKPLLERVMVGRRLLGTSREMLYRMNVLGMVYRLERDRQILDRIDKEILAVCQFESWNPSHFLDVAEMSLAVALAVDWVGEELPDRTIEVAKTALIEKGIRPSFEEEYSRWVNRDNNWNQVCHGGMIAAAITVAEQEPDLAAETIRRALNGIPYALAEYGPDGVYPEGSTYWGYGTSFSVLTSAMLESAFGTDFGLSDYPAFQESAIFRVLSVAPSGWYYNFADCGDKRSPNGDFTLAWFATKTGNPAFFEKERFLRPPLDMGKLDRHAGAGLIWLSQYEDTTGEPLPRAWKGAGSNPVVIFSGGEHDPRQYYFGGKGGRGSVNHGNMDAGSFVFELDGVRWVVDPGNQPYHALEKTGFQLWGRCQECQRWTLLTKNNFGHSTLTVNGALHRVDGLATIINFEKGDQPTATMELSEVFEGQLASARRTFTKDSPSSLLIEDQIILSEKTQLVTWQLMTTAEVTVSPGGAILRQGGRQLRLEQLSHPALTLSVISLDPPPLQLDRKIDGLKRLELRIPAYLFEKNEGQIIVRLRAN